MRRWRIYNSVDEQWGETPYDNHQAAQMAADFWNSRDNGNKWKPVELRGLVPERLAIAQTE